MRFPVHSYYTKNAKHENHQHSPPKSRLSFEGRCLIFFILSSVWNTRFRVFSDHTDYHFGVERGGGVEDEVADEVLNMCVAQRIAPVEPMLQTTRVKYVLLGK